MFQICCRWILETRSRNSGSEERPGPLQQHDQDQRLERALRRQNSEIGEQQTETGKTFSKPMHVRRRDIGPVRMRGRLVAERHPRLERRQQHLRRRKHLGRRNT